MNDPPRPRRVRVGVRLPQPPVDHGEWLADVAAFDAAGADALWIDAGSLDPLAVAAALSTITFRSLLVTALPEDSRDALDRTLTTIGRLSRGRLALRGDPGRLADLTGMGIFHPLDDGAFSYGTGLRWEPVPAPESRAAWSAAVADAAQRGVAGLLVPAGPRLLDLLRNPDEPIDRRDLHLAQG